MHLILIFLQFFSFLAHFRSFLTNFGLILLPKFLFFPIFYFDWTFLIIYLWNYWNQAYTLVKNWNYNEFHTFLPNFAYLTPKMTYYGPPMVKVKNILHFSYIIPYDLMYYTSKSYKNIIIIVWKWILLNISLEKGVWPKGAWLQRNSYIFKNSTQIFFEAQGMPNLNQHSNWGYTVL